MLVYEQETNETGLSYGLVEKARIMEKWFDPAVTVGRITPLSHWTKFQPTAATTSHILHMLLFVTSGCS